MESSELVLIDFGIAQSWEKPKDYSHVDWSKVNEFRGNVLFASHNAFRGYSLSRRDDLIQLAYLLCFLVTGKFTWMGDKDLLEADNYFEEIYKVKVKIKPTHLCVKEAATFDGFVREAFRLGFKETPNYDKIRHLIRSACLE